MRVPRRPPKKAWEEEKIYFKQHHQPKVLVSCKHKSNAQNIKDQIQSFGYAALCVSDPHQSATLLSENREIKLVVTDHELRAPELRGILSAKARSQISFIVVEHGKETQIARDEGDFICIPAGADRLEESARQCLEPSPIIHQDIS